MGAIVVVVIGRCRHYRHWSLSSVFVCCYWCVPVAPLTQGIHGARATLPMSQPRARRQLPLGVHAPPLLRPPPRPPRLRDGDILRNMLRIDHLAVPKPRPGYRSCEDFVAERELCEACLAWDDDKCVHIGSPRCVMRWFTRNKCGHGSLGRSWRCEECGWSLCGPCFAKWPSRSGERVRRALNARPLWAPVVPYIGLGDCSLTPQIWVLRRDWEQRVAEGRCNGWWSEQNTRYVGKRCPLDIRFCMECSARLFSSAGPTRVQCAN